MYRLMVVEDEERIRMGIVHAIDWAAMGFEVVGEAINGRDALRKYADCTPDVILTDVRMPVMDGLELVRHLKSENSHVHFVILSGFSDFETVRAALKSQVDDYLLKPTDKKSLIQTFTLLKTKLDRQVEEEQAVRQQQALLKEGLFELRRSFLSALVQGAYTDAGQLEDRLNALEISLTGDSHVVVKLQARKNLVEPILSASESDVAEKCSDSWLTDQIDKLNLILEEKEIGIAFPTATGQIVFILSLQHEQNNELSIQQTVLDLLQSMQVQDTRWQSVYAGIGHIYPNLTQMSKSYLEADQALSHHFFNTETPVVTLLPEFDPDQTVQKWLNEYPYEINEIVNKVIAGHAEFVSQMIDQVFNNFRNKNQTPDFVKDYCYVMMFLLKSNIAGLVEKTEETTFRNFEQVIRKSESIDELQEYIHDRFVLIASQISALKDDRKGNNNRTIAILKAYIEANYANELTLEDLSKHVFLTPVYISFLFKSITGENYMSYLRKVRLLKARDLLLKDNYKVYEVSHLVGYSDYKYFTSQFKKMFGISPTDFRDQHGMELGP